MRRHTQNTSYLSLCGSLTEEDYAQSIPIIIIVNPKYSYTKISSICITITIASKIYLLFSYISEMLDYAT